MVDQALLLEKITRALTGTKDVRDLSRKAVRLMVKEFGGEDLIGVGVFRIHPDERRLYAYAYEGKHTDTEGGKRTPSFDKDNLNVPISEKTNYVVRTIDTGRIQQSENLANFTAGVINKNDASIIQEQLGAKLCISLPIFTKSGKAVGATLYLLSVKKIDPNRLNLLQTFADQLGLAFSNTMAYERLMDNYRRDLAKLTSREEDQDIPSLKFTLRITPRQNTTLEKLSKQQNRTKAEILRDLIDKKDLHRTK